jgi:hypothetical protein
VDNPDAQASTSCEADGNKCTVDHCDGQGHCVLDHNVTCAAPVPPCEGGQHCDTASGQCVDNPDAQASTSCEADGNRCTVDHCDGRGHCVLDHNVTCAAPVPPCEGGQHCNTTTGQCVDNPDAAVSTVCDADADTCTLDHCDGAGHCVFQENNPACALGCRLTGGGIGCDPKKNTNCVAEVSKATFGGQVGAPCGCIGCFDEFGHIQGNWTYSRKQHQGSFHAMDYNSLVCGCDGDFTNGLCNPGNRQPGPEPRPAPANMACFSGVGEYSPTGGKRTLTVAFRVEVEDRSEPGGGNGAPPPDVYRIRIWIPVPSSGETARELAAGACCTNPIPTGKAARRPEVDDGGDLLHGNLQIQPELRHSTAAICPVPSGRCVPLDGR